MIRAGSGPFKNNVSDDGVHIHHAVPGVILLVTGAFAAVATDNSSVWSVVAGILVGIGTSLVLDEFALILHLDDVYWSAEGRVSVEMVSLAVAYLGLLVLGLRPSKPRPARAARLRSSASSSAWPSRSCGSWSACPRASTAWRSSGRSCRPSHSWAQFGWRSRAPGGRRGGTPRRSSSEPADVPLAVTIDTAPSPVRSATSSPARRQRKLRQPRDSASPRVPRHRRPSDTADRRRWRPGRGTLRSVRHATAHRGAGLWSWGDDPRRARPVPSIPRDLPGIAARWGRRSGRVRPRTAGDHDE